MSVTADYSQFAQLVASDAKVWFQDGEMQKGHRDAKAAHEWANRAARASTGSEDDERAVDRAFEAAIDALYSQYDAYVDASNRRNEG